MPWKNSVYEHGHAEKSRRARSTGELNELGDSKLPADNDTLSELLSVIPRVLKEPDWFGAVWLLCYLIQPL